MLRNLVKSLPCNFDLLKLADYNSGVKLSIVIPALNEAHRIEQTLEKVHSFCTRELSQWEIVVVDDGSVDGTQEKVERVGHARCLRNSRNSGKGYSVRRGILESSIDPVLFTDADLSAPIEEALPLLGAIEAGADVAIGSRAQATGKRVHRTPHRRLMAAAFRLLVKLIVIRGFHDTQCGLKMFRRDAGQAIFSRQRLDRWGFDVEVLYLARKLGFRIDEVSINWSESTESRLRLTTPLSMALDLVKIRWYSLTGAYRLGRSVETPPSRGPREDLEGKG